MILILSHFLGEEKNNIIAMKICFDGDVYHQGEILNFCVI